MWEREKAVVMSSPMVVGSHGVAPHRLWLEIYDPVLEY